MSKIPAIDHSITTSIGWAWLVIILAFFAWVIFKCWWSGGATERAMLTVWTTNSNGAWERVQFGELLRRMVINARTLAFRQRVIRHLEDKKRKGGCLWKE